MSVEIGQLDMDVTAEGGQASATAPAAQAGPADDARRLRELHAQWKRDSCRTRAEGYDD